MDFRESALVSGERLTFVQEKRTSKLSASDSGRDHERMLKQVYIMTNLTFKREVFLMCLPVRERRVY